MTTPPNNLTPGEKLDDLRTEITNRLQFANMNPDADEAKFEQYADEIIQALADFIEGEVERIIGSIEDPNRIHVSHAVHGTYCRPQLDMWVRDNLRIDQRLLLKELVEGLRK